MLLDTCTFVWLVADAKRLGRTARKTLNDAKRELFLSDASVWEIALKWQAGKLTLPEPPRRWVEAQARQWALRGVPISRAHLYRVTELPDHHRDPFDRILVAQAIEHHLTIVTPDPCIRQYPVAVLW